MDSILVRGGRPLNGQIHIAGAKNACLTLMPATLLSEEPLTLTNAPRLSDIATMTQLLQSLGAEVSSLQGGQVIAMSSHGPINHVADYDIVRKMRASNLVLGPLLAREGHAVVSLPGGCAIGARPMDLHIEALEALGAEIELRSPGNGALVGNQTCPASIRACNGNERDSLSLSAVSSLTAIPSRRACWIRESW